MDRVPRNEGDFVIDIDQSCVGASQVTGNPSILDIKIEKMITEKLCGSPLSVDRPLRGESMMHLNKIEEYSVDVSPISSEKNVRKEKRKAAIAKKPPKPPRPPRGLSLDAADQKLIKELAELALIKHARIERMKALKKMKAAKLSSPSSSSGNFVAMLFTIVFFVVIIFQGISPKNSSSVGFSGSKEWNREAENNFIMAQENWYQHHPLPSTSESPLTDSGSPYLVEMVRGSDSKDNGKRAAD